MTDIQILLITALAVIAFGGYLWLCDRVRG
jgi:hypothetical protein